LKNSQLTSGNIPAISGTGHKLKAARLKHQVDRVRSSSGSKKIHVDKVGALTGPTSHNGQKGADVCSTGLERFFGELTSEEVREGSFQSLRELVRAIESYLVERNRNPKKYVWRACGLEILEKIKRARAALATAAVIST
jgi:hypothetical protein